jgi:hypothetical protein
MKIIFSTLEIKLTLLVLMGLYETHHVQTLIETFNIRNCPECIIAAAEAIDRNIRVDRCLFYPT